MVDLQPLGPDSDLGRYRLVRLLGRGGMGEVYLARDQSLERDVAIKFIAPEKTADEDARRRLMREARAAAALDHPAICTVHETGETATGRTYIVMQYIEGEPLTLVLEKRQLSVREALLLCAQIAEALDVAHRHGVVHRDLKPANVMLTPGGHPKLVDFGIAKVLVTGDQVVENATTTEVGTTAGVIVGTPAYMSPEQAQQRTIDGRSDLFSLGAVLFECLTGRRAFQGATSLEIVANVLHVHPPAPSSLRPELDERHDELCRRLLAKEPADRFQSAQEVVGAIRLLVPDTSRQHLETGPHRAGDHQEPLRPGGFNGFFRRQRWLLVAALIVMVAGISGAAWFWTSPGLTPAPAEAEAWFDRGTNALREGAYYQASRAFETALRQFPGYTLAYIRLAEARAELDDQRLAQDSLLRAQIPTRLAKAERLRIDAIRSLLIRDVDAAIASYSQLTQLNPADAGTWLDLGRAQETAGLRSDARASYERAIAADRQYAPGYVRLGSVEALASRRDEAVAAFEAAERLYRAAVDVEGQTEVLLRRGLMFDSFGELKAARGDLERALSLATEMAAPYQQVRARLALSSVTASEGRFAEAERLASAAVQDALTRGLETVAADGLIDLAVTLNAGKRSSEAETQVKRAIQLAENRGAKRTAARAQMQLASIYLEQNLSNKALSIVSGVLPFLKENRYRRFELLALSIVSRGHAQLDELDQAQKIASDVLNVAETLKDEGQVALAAANLASVATALGNYPEALTLRLRAESIHRRQGDNYSLPYDLGNRADLLIRLGRAHEAGAALTELEAGIAAGIDSFVGRQTRAVFFRAFAATTTLRCQEAAPLLRRLEKEATPGDLPAVLAPAIAAFCDAVDKRPSRPIVAAPQEVEATLATERLYWLAAAALQRGEWQEAHADAMSGLRLLKDRNNDELRWRLSAVAARAARELGNESIFAQLSSAGREALSRLEARWKQDFAAYAARVDLVDLRKRTFGN
ncbi:MAG: protein kinase [Vicinamibacterales bacterium]